MTVSKLLLKLGENLEHEVPVVFLLVPHKVEALERLVASRRHGRSHAFVPLLACFSLIVHKAVEIEIVGFGNNAVSIMIPKDDKTTEPALESLVRLGRAWQKAYILKYGVGKRDWRLETTEIFLSQRNRPGLVSFANRFFGTRGDGSDRRDTRKRCRRRNDPFQPPFGGEGTIAGSLHGANIVACHCVRQKGYSPICTTKIERLQQGHLPLIFFGLPFAVDCVDTKGQRFFCETAFVRMRIRCQWRILPSRKRTSPALLPPLSLTQLPSKLSKPASEGSWSSLCIPKDSFFPRGRCLEKFGKASLFLPKRFEASSHRESRLDKTPDFARCKDTPASSSWLASENHFKCCKSSSLPSRGARDNIAALNWRSAECRFAKQVLRLLSMRSGTK